MNKHLFGMLQAAFRASVDVGSSFVEASPGGQRFLL